MKTRADHPVSQLSKAVQTALVLAALFSLLAASVVSAAPEAAPEASPEASSAAAAQKEASGEVPRTAWGTPDLTGTYDVATLTPLSRPSQFGDKLYLSEEEAKAIEEEEKALLQRGLDRSDPDRDAPAEGGAAPVGFDESVREEFGAGSVGGYNSFWIDRGDSAFSVDGFYRTSIITDPKNGQQPKMTDAAIAKRREAFKMYRPNSGTAWWLEMEGPGPYDDIESRPPAERCLMGFGSTQGPPMLPVLYNNHKRIVQTETHVMILVEMIHDARIIPIVAKDEITHEPEDSRRWLGDSQAYWDGDTLIIQTMNFRDQLGLGSASRNLKVTERLRRIDSEDLHYEFTVEDPETWTASWSGDYLWPGTSNKVYEYACHEGNYAMGSIMRGARLLEREALAGGATGKDD